MKRILVLTLAVGFFASAALGANLNVRVLSGSDSEITVAPGDTVNYRVVGQLSDAGNQGVALVGFTLELWDVDGGAQAAPLTKADIPMADPMLNFRIPEGINNPDAAVEGDGYAGTESGGKLLQCGGAQNTIHNTVGCTTDDDCPGASNLCDPVTFECSASAPFPVGTVILNVARDAEEEFLTGSLTIPPGAALGSTYELRLTELFANAISTDQPSLPDFHTTEDAPAGTIGNLTINISACAAATATASAPADQHSLWRSKKNIVRITFSADVTAPAPGEIEIVACQAGCVEGADQSGFFDISIEDPGTGPRVLRLQDTDLDATRGHLDHATWYKVRNVSWACVDPFEYQFRVQYGNATDDLFVDNTDLSTISENFGFYFGQDDVPWDINGDMFVDNQDMSIANDNFTGFVPNLCCGN
ncbi:MAG: hypothetical protein ACYTFA_05975 [Planctomycetota bacterium]|jgi:hypothetical protein